MKKKAGMTLAALLAAAVVLSVTAHGAEPPQAVIGSGDGGTAISITDITPREGENKEDSENDTKNYTVSSYYPVSVQTTEEGGVQLIAVGNSAAQIAGNAGAGGLKLVQLVLAVQGDGAQLVDIRDQTLNLGAVLLVLTLELGRPLLRLLQLGEVGDTLPGYGRGAVILPPGRLHRGLHIL